MILSLLACHSPSVPTGVGGMSLGLFASDPLYDYGPLIEEIHTIGASDVLIVVPWTLENPHADGLVPKLPRSQVRQALRQVRATGMRLSVMPLVELEDTRGTWRGKLEPTRRDRFWSNHDTLLLQLARDAEAAGAVRLVVGSELASLEDDPSWPGRIAAVREAFSGTVTYSANWDRYDRVPFWHHVDEIGVSAYWPPSSWDAAMDRTEAFARAAGRPLLVTEVGFPPLSSATVRPWDQTTGAPYALQLQADLLQAATSDLQQRNAPYFIWNWFGHGGRKDVSFSPRGRPAEQVVRCAFVRNAPGCTP